MCQTGARSSRAIANSPGSVRVPSDQVVTSFSSKSELGLHIARDRDGYHLVFVGYAGPGAGALDVSNADNGSSALLGWNRLHRAWRQTALDSCDERRARLRGDAPAS